MSLRDDDFSYSVETPLLDPYRGERQQLKHANRSPWKIRRVIERQYDRTNCFAWKVWRVIERQYDRANYFAWKVRGVIERQYDRANYFAWKVWRVIERQYDRANYFAWKVRRVIERQYDRANYFAWKVRGVIRRQYRRANRFAWKIRTFVEQQLEHKIWLSWKFWALIVIIVGTVFLIIDFREPWTAADYPKLKHPSSSIRVLHIRPGSGKQRVECTMESLPFVNKPHYDALSYTWGDMKRKKSVTVDGKKMDVTENLYEALLSIRLPRETRTVWVDQICIDQSNTDEKNSQVPLMTFIYSRASNVLIWLGYHKPPRWVEKSEELDWTGAWAIAHASLYPQAAIYWLYLLTEEEYWKRCWIIQEVGMASSIRVHFGSQSIPWIEFIKLINWFRTNHHKANVSNILKLDALRQSMYLDRNTFSLPHLLTDFHDSFCSVKLDKVFAFVGMANECRNGCMDVNYNKSPYSVYEDLITLQNLSSEEPLEHRINMPYFASVARQNLERTSSLITKTLEDFGKLADPNSFTYDACGDERAIICSTDSSGSVKSNAMVMDWGVGVIRWLFSFIFRPRTPCEAIWLPAKQESRAIWLPDDSSDSTINQIQVRGFTPGAIGHIGPLYSDFLADPDTAKRWANEIYFYPLGPDRRKARGLNDRFMSLLSASSDSVIGNIAPLGEGPADILGGPRLFLGLQVMIGLLPSNAMVGDLICQFWNTNAAAVVRPGTDGMLHIIGKALFVQDLNSFEWDVPRNRTIFRLPSSTIDLTLDLTTLTQLTLDSVRLGDSGEIDGWFGFETS